MIVSHSQYLHSIQHRTTIYKVWTLSIHIFQTDVRYAWNVNNNLPKVSPARQR